MAKSKTAPKPVQQYHYFGSTAYDWRFGDTQHEVLKALAYWGDGIKAAKKGGKPGMEALIVRVELPQAANYTIHNFMPHKIIRAGEVTDERVPMGPVEGVYLVNTRGETAPRSIND